jgi:hypothetical protein
MFKKAVGEAAASEEARRTLRYVEPLSDARTKLEDFFNIPRRRALWVWQTINVFPVVAGFRRCRTIALRSY